MSNLLGTVNQLWRLVETEPIPLENGTAKLSLWLIQRQLFYPKKSINLSNSYHNLVGAPSALGFQIIPFLFQMHIKNVKHEGIP